MTELIMKISGIGPRSHGEPGLGYRVLVAGLFALSLVSVLAARLLGRKGETSIWREARQTAHAVAGYAYKY